MTVFLGALPAVLTYAVVHARHRSGRGGFGQRLSTNRVAVATMR
jgi:hypothetical protein